jgi:hypothetical protein
VPGGGRAVCAEAQKDILSEVYDRYWTQKTRRGQPRAGDCHMHFTLTETLSKNGVFVNCFFAGARWFIIVSGESAARSKKFMPRLPASA